MCCWPSFLRPLCAIRDQFALPLFSASAFLAQSCSINCCARARTRSSLSSKARMNGSTAPGGDSRAQASRALSRTSTFGELSFWAINSGTTKPSIGCPGPKDGLGTAWGLFPPGTAPFSDAVSTPLIEARGAGLAAGVTEVNRLLLGDGPCLERGGPPTPVRDSRFGALSDVAGPQLASPVKNSRLTNAMYGRDCHMLLELFRKPDGEIGSALPSTPRGLMSQFITYV